MKRNTMSKILIVALFCVCGLICLYVMAQPKKVWYEEKAPIVNDIGYIEEPQYFTARFLSQKDDRWASENYWLQEDGSFQDMSHSACGLTCYTMTVNILNHSDYTPVDINNMRGDVKHWQGNDDGEEHKDYTLTAFGIKASDNVTDLKGEAAYNFIQTVFQDQPETTCMVGVYGNKQAKMFKIDRDEKNWRGSNGHYVLIVYIDNDHLVLFDPYNKAPMIYTKEEAVETFLNEQFLSEFTFFNK